MRKKLHPLVLTIGILQLLFGVAGLACDAIGMFGAVSLYTEDELDYPAKPAPKSATGKQKGSPHTIEESFQSGIDAGLLARGESVRNAPGFKPITVVEALWGLFLCVVMLASGIGLLFMQPWARWLAIGYGGLSVLARCCFFGYHVTLVLPVLNKLCDELHRSGNDDFVQNLWSSRYGAFLGLLLMLYPLLVMVLLLLPNVGRAFHAAPEDSESDFRLRRRADEHSGWDERFRS